MFINSNYPHYGITRVFFVFFLMVFMSCSGISKRGDVPAAAKWTESRSVLDARMTSLIEGERYEEAIALSDSAAAAGVEDSKIRGQKAYALGAQGRYDESVALFEAVLLKDYPNCENHLNFAVILMRMGKTGRAITEFKEAKRFCDLENKRTIHRNLAVAYIEMGRKPLALKNVNAGLEMMPDDFYLLGLKGMLMVDTEPVMSESLFVKSFRSGDADPEFLFHYGLLLLNTGRAKQAVQVLDSAAVLLPGDRGVRHGLAEALLRAGRAGDSEGILLELSAEGPDEETLEMLARAVFHQKRYLEALEIYMELQRTPEIMDRIAMCHYHLGELEEALQWEKRVLAERPGWPTAMINAAVIFAAGGELDEAVSMLKSALEIDPDNETAAKNLDLLERAVKKAPQ